MYSIFDQKTLPGMPTVAYSKAYPTDQKVYSIRLALGVGIIILLTGPLCSGFTRLMGMVEPEQQQLKLSK